jgi:hypothetical protein
MLLFTLLSSNKRDALEEVEEEGAPILAEILECSATVGWVL